MYGAAMTAIIGVGLDMDKATTAAAVWASANEVDCVEADDRLLPADMLRMLHVVFDADLRHLLERSKVTTNVPCMQPKEPGLTSAGMSYILVRLITRPTTALAWMDLSRIALQEARS